ncbi:FixH family protein [Brevibacillus dissolubilis]|uniref:FixH family protein n=1 Tax=Brevibacillus dissolubilis TaxID=1844116 RepID=UPI0021005921|nr:FixH family protein [Brevibacillus dissolubilis]
MYVQLLWIFLFGLFLTACSVDQEAVQLYRQEKPIDIEITVPNPIVLNQPQIFTAVLRQDGSAVDDAEDVRFMIWKEGSTSPHDTMAASNAGNGTYTVEKTIDGDGVYYVKVQASADGSKVMPTKRFIVGDIPEGFDLGNKQDSGHHHEHH